MFDAKEWHRLVGESEARREEFVNHVRQHFGRRDREMEIARVRESDLLHKAWRDADHQLHDYALLHRTEFGAP
jgi:hypothetical protein